MIQFLIDVVDFIINMILPLARFIVDYSWLMIVVVVFGACAFKIFVSMRLAHVIEAAEYQTWSHALCDPSECAHDESCFDVADEDDDED
jgi:hypothetical protein